MLGGQRPVHRGAHAGGADLRVQGLPDHVRRRRCRRPTTCPLFAEHDSLYRWLLKGTAPRPEDRFQTRRGDARPAARRAARRHRARRRRRGHPQHAVAPVRDAGGRRRRARLERPAAAGRRRRRPDGARGWPTSRPTTRRRAMLAFDQAPEQTVGGARRPRRTRRSSCDQRGPAPRRPPSRSSPPTRGSGAACGCTGLAALQAQRRADGRRRVQRGVRAAARRAGAEAGAGPGVRAGGRDGGGRADVRAVRPQRRGVRRAGAVRPGPPRGGGGPARRGARPRSTASRPPAGPTATPAASGPMLLAAAIDDDQAARRPRRGGRRAATQATMDPQARSRPAHPDPRLGAATRAADNGAEPIGAIAGVRGRRAVAAHAASKRPTATRPARRRPGASASGSSTRPTPSGRRDARMTDGEPHRQRRVDGACPSCGAPVAAGDAFCESCGAHAAARRAPAAGASWRRHQRRRRTPPARDATARPRRRPPAGGGVRGVRRRRSLDDGFCGTCGARRAQRARSLERAPSAVGRRRVRQGHRPRPQRGRDGAGGDADGDARRARRLRRGHHARPTATAPAWPRHVPRAPSCSSPRSAGARRAGRGASIERLAQGAHRGGGAGQRRRRRRRPHAGRPAGAAVVHVRRRGASPATCSAWPGAATRAPTGCPTTRHGAAAHRRPLARHRDDPPRA